MTAGVVIDSWKLAIFKRHLDAAGYEYTEQAFTTNTILLKVTAEWIHKLQPVIQAAQDECARTPHD